MPPLHRIGQCLKIQMPDDDDTAAKTEAQHGRYRTSDRNFVYLHRIDSADLAFFHRCFPVRRMLPGALAVLLLIPARAEAGLDVCNTTKSVADVALGLQSDGGWQSRGWWSIPPGQCRTVIAAKLKARYYYLYATDGGAGTWGGKTAFCTERSNAFAIGGRGRCSARGYDTKGFFEIDTRERPDWKQSLSD